MTDNTNRANITDPVNLSPEERAILVEKKVTCPFIGAAVAEGQLPVLNDPGNPLASIEMVRALGNTGGGNLGDLLVFFAKGNQAFMRGDTGKLDRHVPMGLFSLEFPGSQGSHAGDSGILQSEPKVLDSGRFSAENFARLISRAENGCVKRSDFGRFIAENLHNDPKANVLGQNTLALLTATVHDAIDVVEDAISAVWNYFFSSDDEENQNATIEDFARLIARDHLVGSAGEFGLLFAFLVNSPRTINDDEPALSVDDLTAMFVHKKFPDGWETWKKSWGDWLTNTAALAMSAELAYRGFGKDPLRTGGAE